MSERTVFYCAGGCGREVRGIYCPEHREARGAALKQARAERSRALKEAWARDPEGMKRKLQEARAAKRAPATEEP